MHAAWRFIRSSLHSPNLRSLTSLQTSRAAGSKLGEDEHLPVLAIIGRPNVGKSALFNRLVRRSDALVKDTPEDHVTRDYKMGLGSLGDLRFRVVDTSGLEPFMAEDSIQGRATTLTASVLQDANAAIFLLDAKSGVSHADLDLSRWIRKIVSVPLILAANKAENDRNKGAAVQEQLAEATRLGLGEPVAISASTGEGMADLYQELQPILDELKQRKDLELQSEAPQEVWKDRIRIAILGLPNVGKSTLLNTILGRQRSITGPEPGLTRDCVTQSFTFNGHTLDIIDTAGWLDRKRLLGPKLGGDLADKAQMTTERAYNSAHVVVLLVDAVTAEALDTGITRREIALASDVIKQGRAIVLAVNKLDALHTDSRWKVMAKLEKQLQQQLPGVQGAACLGVSAMTGEGVQEILQSAVRGFTVWNHRVNTSDLNKWLTRTAEQYSLDGHANEILRVRYVTQVHVRPPSFVAFVSGSTPFSASSIAFLGKSLRREFGYDGVPLRIDIRMRQKLKKLKSSKKDAFKIRPEAEP